MDTINRVWHGDAGLARTYWLFGGLLGALFWFPLGVVTPGSLSAVLLAAVLGVFLVWVNMGIWRAASKYEGPSLWAGLARAAAALGFVMAAAAIVGVMFAVAAQSWKEPASKSQYPGLVPFAGKLDEAPEKKAPCGDIDAFLEQCDK